MTLISGKSEFTWNAMATYNNVAIKPYGFTYGPVKFIVRDASDDYIIDLFEDDELTSKGNPNTADQLGNVHFKIDRGEYTIEIRDQHSALVSVPTEIDTNVKDLFQFRYSIPYAISDESFTATTISYNTTYDDYVVVSTVKSNTANYRRRIVQQSQTPSFESVDSNYNRRILTNVMILSFQWNDQP